MKKIMMGMITGFMILVFCAGCSSTTNDNSSNALIVEDGMIKYSNNGKLEEVIALEDLLAGKDNTSVVGSKEIELFVEDGYIVWNYIGETSVHKLIAVEDLVGKQGETGAKGATGATGAQGPVGATGATGSQGAAGADGSSAYIWVKYLDNDPEQSTDEDLIDTCSNYMGIYYGTLASAPNDIASYQWYEIKGEKGDKGETGAQGEAGSDGTNAYVWIRYLENAPEYSEDSNLSENPNNYMGVYSGRSDTAPTTISSYQWFKIKGEKGDKGDQGIQGEQGIQGIQGEKGDKGDQGEKGVTGETGATGPQGPQGSIDLETYYDNLAVVSFSIYSTSSNISDPPKRSSNIVYQGSNINVEVDSFSNNLTINTPGDYIIELDGVVSFDAQSSTGSTIHKATSSFISSSVTIDNADGYGHFYAVNSKHIEGSEKTTFNIGWELKDWSGSGFFNKYNYEFTFKIHKK